MIYFINYKNAATLKNKADRLEENYPKEHFVFTAKQVPGTRPVTATYFYKRHRKFLDKLGMLDKGYTLYG